MYTNQLQFFQLRSHLDIQKNGLSKLDPNFQQMKFLILMLQISYFLNIQLLVLRISPGQTQLIKTIYLLCGGMLIFLTLTIYFIWISKCDFQFENNFSKKTHVF